MITNLCLLIAGLVCFCCGNYAHEYKHAVMAFVMYVLCAACFAKVIIDVLAM